MLCSSILDLNQPSASLYFISLFNKVVILRKFMFYLVFCVVFVLSAFDLSLTCYDVVLFVILLQYFICMKTIQTADLIGRIYKMMIVSMC